jgi:hypothetical protein
MAGALRMDQDNKYNKGMTGGVFDIPISEPQRHLNDRLMAQLRKLVKRDDNIEIYSVLGDLEALRFATEVKNYLESIGYTIAGQGQAIYPKPMEGHCVVRDPKNMSYVQIIIGRNVC